MRKSPGINAAVVVIATIALTLLVSCGSSSKSASTTTTKPSSAATKVPASTPAASAALVSAKKTSKLGTVLADKDGLTLYTLSKDGKAVACTGPCLQVWPPLTLPAGETTPKGADGITGLSAAKANGLTMVAVNGLPLYRFVKDKDSGDAYGEGIASFGGVWHVSKTTATPSAPAENKSSATTAPTTQATTSSGY